LSQGYDTFVLGLSFEPRGGAALGIPVVSTGWPKPFSLHHLGLIFRMQKTAEYLRRAAECRDLARSASASRREELEHMAATFEQLAKVRKRRLQLGEKMDDNSGESDCGI
jgi:hypothetical protein